MCWLQCREANRHCWVELRCQGLGAWNLTVLARFSDSPWSKNGGTHTPSPMGGLVGGEEWGSMWEFWLGLPKGWAGGRVWVCGLSARPPTRAHTLQHGLEEVTPPTCFAASHLAKGMQPWRGGNGPKGVWGLR